MKLNSRSAPEHRPHSNTGLHSKIQRARQGNVKLSKKKSFKDKTNPEFLKDSIWRVFCDEKVMTTKGLVTVKYVEP